MNILVSSHSFAPAIGGLESASMALILEFTSGPHDVLLVTQTTEQTNRSWPFKVYRKPPPIQILRALRWSELFFHNNISLQTAWPLLIIKRPWVITHQTWLSRPNGRRNWQDFIKRRLLRYATNIAISEAVAKDIGVPATVIGNPYADSVFKLIPEVPRDRDLVFLGRLVSDKGADTLLTALRELRTLCLRPKVTIIGTGEEEPKLRRMTEELGIAADVEFAGALSGPPLAEALNRHRIMVVPSRWAEPFGIVALEGIACGCVVVGTAGGGLPDAMGPCGRTFPSGDASALAGILRDLLSHPEEITALRQGAEAHLEKFTPKAVAAAYLRIFEPLVEADWEKRLAT